MPSARSTEVTKATKRWVAGRQSQRTVRAKPATRTRRPARNEVRPAASTPGAALPPWGGWELQQGVVSSGVTGLPPWGGWEVVAAQDRSPVHATLSAALPPWGGWEDERLIARAAPAGGALPPWGLWSATS